MVNIVNENMGCMNLLIFKTDIETRRKVKKVATVFDRQSIILDWSVDTDDIDNVLRIEATDGTEESAIINLVNKYGFSCEVLED